MLSSDLNHIAWAKSHVINKLRSTDMNTGTCMGTTRQTTIFEKKKKRNVL